MTRLDVELVARGLARSRGHARDLVDLGVVRVGGDVAHKPALAVTAADDICLDVPPDPRGAPVLDAHWVSRAAGKLLGALDDLPGGGPRMRGRRAADIGACTGGFTQVLLERGAEHVHAIDVGHDQLAAVLRADPRVSDLSGLNARDLTADHVGGAVDLVVADLSFISLTRVLDRLAAITAAGGDLLVLIKPQFEVGRAGLDRRGVVRPGPWRRDAIRSVLAAAHEAGLGLEHLVSSRTRGQDGNTEFIAWLRKPGPPAPGDSAPDPTWDSVRERIDALIAAAESATNGDHG